MANRKKRIAQATQQYQHQKQFRLRLQASKKQQKKVDCNLAAAFNEQTAKITGCIPHKDFKVYFNRLSALNKKVFIAILNHPKIAFTEYKYYLVLLQVLVISQNIARPLSAWKTPKSKAPAVVLKSLFVHLFVQYRLPKVVIGSVSNILLTKGVDSWQGRLLLGLAVGEGLHRINFVGFHFPINSKSNYHFYQAPEEYTLMQALAWAKLRSSKVGYTISNILARKLYKDYYQKWPTWMAEVTGFLQRHPQITATEINQILSFLIFQKIRPYQMTIPDATYKIEVTPLFPTFSLKGRTLASVKKYLEKWKVYLAAMKIAGTHGNLPVSRFKGFTYRMNNGRMYTFKQILSVKDLIMEGKRMNHCVGSYVGACMEKRSSIWSAQLRFPKGQLKKVLTIEIDEQDSTVAQVQGMCNRNHSKEEDIAIKAWMAAEQLEEVEGGY